MGAEAPRLTQGVSGHPREDDPVRGEEDRALGWQQCRAAPGAPRAFLPPVGQQVDAKAVQHTLLSGQQARPKQLGLFGEGSGASGLGWAPGPPPWHPLTFWMGGSLLLSLCTASRVSMCIWTMSGGEQFSRPGLDPPTQGECLQAQSPYLAP